MIKFFIAQVAKLVSPRRKSRSSGARPSDGASAAQARVAAVDATASSRASKSRGVDPQPAFFDYAESGDRLAWPARDASKPREPSEGPEPLHAALAMRTADDATRLIEPMAKPCQAPPDRTVLLKVPPFPSRPADDSTRIITPRTRP